MLSAAVNMGKDASITGSLCCVYYYSISVLNCTLCLNGDDSSSIPVRYVSMSYPFTFVYGTGIKRGLNGI